MITWGKMKATKLESDQDLPERISKCHAIRVLHVEFSAWFRADFALNFESDFVAAWHGKRRNPRNRGAIKVEILKSIYDTMIFCSALTASRPSVAPMGSSTDWTHSCCVAHSWRDGHSILPLKIYATGLWGSNLLLVKYGGGIAVGSLAVWRWDGNEQQRQRQALMQGYAKSYAHAVTSSHAKTSVEIWLEIQREICLKTLLCNTLLIEYRTWLAFQTFEKSFEGRYWGRAVSAVWTMRKHIIVQLNLC
jgi:hypothetical protein